MLSGLLAMKHSSKKAWDLPGLLIIICNIFPKSFPSWPRHSETINDPQPAPTCSRAHYPNYPLMLFLPSNHLIGVNDGIGTPFSQNGFKDAYPTNTPNPQNQATHEYNYDANGNLWFVFNAADS
jgi:hypothetical protein